MIAAMAVLAIMAVGTALVLVLLSAGAVRNKHEECEARLERARAQIRGTAFMLQFDYPADAQVLHAAEQTLRTGEPIDVRALRAVLDNRERTVRARVVKCMHDTAGNFRRTAS
jgi:type II secretory pathway pseudopilin PulG